MWDPGFRKSEGSKGDVRVRWNIWGGRGLQGPFGLGDRSHREGAAGFRDQSL